MVDELTHLVRSNMVHIPSVLSATFQITRRPRNQMTILSAVCEMLWGVVIENITTHISSLRDYPRGHFTSLSKALSARLADCPSWWLPSCTLIGTNDSNGVKATVTVAGCPSMQISGEDAITYRCVSASFIRLDVFLRYDFTTFTPSVCSQRNVLYWRLVC